MVIKGLAPWNDLRDDHSPIFGELIFGKRYNHLLAGPRPLPGVLLS